jgi:hypothetical protein
VFALFPYRPILPADASLAMRLAGYVLWVLGAVGDRTRRVPSHDVARGIVPQAVYERIAVWVSARKRAIEAVMARLGAGKAYRPRGYAPRPAAAGVARVPRPVAAADAPLFRGFGWICRWAPEAGVGAHQLMCMLEDAEMRALVMAAPGPMVRAWAPLLTALGLRRPAWFPVLPKRVRVRSTRDGQGDPLSPEIGHSSCPVPGSSPGMTRPSRLPRGEGAVAGDRRVKPGDDGEYKPGDDGYRMGTTKSDPAPPHPPPEPSFTPVSSPLPPMAVWTGRGPGPCRTLAEYRSPFEPPLWEVRVPKKS